MTTSRTRQIEDRLRERLGAVHVEVVDESVRHAGHPGAEAGGGHFVVHVVSPRFEGATLVAAQRMVYDALSDLMDRDIHALQMRTMTPAQWRELEG